MAYKMKGSPFQRNFGIGSPAKQNKVQKFVSNLIGEDKDELKSRTVDKDGNKLYGSKKKDGVGEDKYQQKGSGNEGGLVKVLDYSNQRKSAQKPGDFKGISFDTWSKGK